MKFSKLVLMGIGAGFVAQSTFAFDVRSMSTECTQREGPKISINKLKAEVDGGDTGTFVREVLKHEKLKAIQSCVLIPSSPTSAQSESMFALNKYTGKPDQVPYLYLGANIDKKMYEAGLFYESIHADGKRPGYRLFTSGFFGKRIQYYRQYTFRPGDKVCIRLERYNNSGRLDFKVVVPGSTREGRPLKSEVVITEYQAPIAPQKIEFKRVSGMAVRSQDLGADYGANGGMNAKRYSELIKDRVYAAFIWTDLRYVNNEGAQRVASLNDLSVDAAGSSLCRKSTVWPSQGFAITPVGGSGSMLIEMVPQNRASYSSILTDEVSQFLSARYPSRPQQSVEQNPVPQRPTPVSVPQPGPSAATQRTSPQKPEPQSSSTPSQTSTNSNGGFSSRSEKVVYEERIETSGGMSPDVNYEPYIPDGTERSGSTDSSSPSAVEYEKCCSGDSCRQVVKSENIWRLILSENLYQKICYNFFD